MLVTHLTSGCQVRTLPVDVRMEHGLAKMVYLLKVLANNYFSY
jgi:hypothetical protein